MSGEFDTIARYFAPLASDAGALGLTDDAALLTPPAGRQLVLTADAMIAGVHFFEDDPPDSIARKLIRVNLSDLAAMGARPLAFLLTCAWRTSTDERWIEAFAQGLGRDCADFGFKLLGGDMTAGPGPINLSLTAIGTAAPGKSLTRGGAKPGDLVLVSGSIGDGALGLMALTGKLPHLSSEDLAFLTERFHLPRPRLALGAGLAEEGLASACLDVSDGLVADLGHICVTSRVAARIEAAALPLSRAAQEAVAADPDLYPQLMTGGDDYELAFTARPEALGAIRALAERVETPVAVIGRIEAGEGVTVLDRDGEMLPLKRRGWTHF